MCGGVWKGKKNKTPNFIFPSATGGLGDDCGVRGTVQAPALPSTAGLEEPRKYPGWPIITKKTVPRPATNLWRRSNPKGWSYEGDIGGWLGDPLSLPTKLWRRNNPEGLVLRGRIGAWLGEPPSRGLWTNTGEDFCRVGYETI